MFCRHVFGNISGGFRGISRFFGNFAGPRPREISEALKGVTFENKTIHTRPLSPTFKVEESAVVSYRHSSSNSSIPLNGGGEGGGAGNPSVRPFRT